MLILLLQQNIEFYYALTQEPAELERRILNFKGFASVNTQENVPLPPLATVLSSLLFALIKLQQKHSFTSLWFNSFVCKRADLWLNILEIFTYLIHIWKLAANSKEGADPLGFSIHKVWGFWLRQCSAFGVGETIENRLLYQHWNIHQELLN